MKFLPGVLVLTVLLTPLGVVRAQQRVVFDQPDQFLPLGPHALVFADSSASLSLEQVRRLPLTAFTPNAAPDLRFDVPGRLWLRFDLDNRTPEPLRLIIKTQMVEAIDVYVVSSTGVQHTATGLKRPFRNRYFLINWITLSLGAQPKQLFVVVQHPYRFYLPLSLTTDQPLVRLVYRETLYNGSIMGLMLVMAFVNVCLFFLLRDRTYLFYSGYVLVSLLTFLSFEGLLFDLLWPDFPALNDGRLALMLRASTYVLAVLFSVNFLHTKRLLPRFHRVLVGSAWAMAGAAQLTLVHAPFAESLIYLLVVLGLVALIGAGAATYRKGYGPARYYLVAWGFYAVGVISTLLAFFNLLDFNSFLTSYGYTLGAACEATFLSFALADRLNTFRKEAREAQSLAIQRLEENEGLLARQNELMAKNLDEKVADPSRRDVDQLVRLLREERDRVRKISIPTLDGVLLFPLADITRLEAAGSYTNLFLSNQKKVMASRSIAEFEHLCTEGEPFFRTHKSHIVNLNYVTKYLRGEGGQVVLTDGTAVDVSRRAKPELMRSLLGEE